jgi:hypothetical protein
VAALEDERDIDRAPELLRFPFGRAPRGFSDRTETELLLQRAWRWRQILGLCLRAGQLCYRDRKARGKNECDRDEGRSRPWRGPGRGKGG